MIYYVNDTVFVSQRLLQPSIVTSGQRFIWGKPLQPSESLDIFFQKIKNGFHGNSITDCKTYVPQERFIWVVKIKDVDFN